MITYDIPLTFLVSLRTNDILPWAAAAPAIEYLTYMMNREPAYEYFRVSVHSVWNESKAICHYFVNGAGNGNLML